DGGCRLLAFVEQAPNPSSRLTLSDERDALGTFRSKLDWRGQRSEIDTLANFASEVKVAFESKGLADIDIEKQVADRNPDLGRLPGVRSATSCLRGALSQRAPVRLRETAFDAGIRHFDTAPAYGLGASEAIVGEFLARHRGQVSITTKFGLLPPKSKTLLGTA